MKKRAAILLSVALAFVGVVLAFPKGAQMRASRLAKDLPEQFGDWSGRPQEPGEREKKVLAGDTEFERMEYSHLEGTRPPVQVSIVFSGKNLSQSIHRPEVCLRAQGWEFSSERYFTWDDVLPNGEKLPVKEIICRIKRMKEDENGDPVPALLANGEPSYEWRVFYYTFFGHSKILAGHYQRTGEDIKDRLFKGYDQRWAYATVSSFISQKYADQGFSLGSLEVLDEEGTKEHIMEFLKELLPLIVSDAGEGTDPSLSSGGILNHE
ncbi:EpsI family protein [Akkermansiaceae bacterium]|nr:EpsI family protein [Akkermansiaceae bacterium]MDA7888643.1 EpsI family protein [Akkermansiaceae bacterium]MDB4537905.1 EpsI family protein [Akkermansiaceae bacterium]